MSIFGLLALIWLVTSFTSRDTTGTSSAAARRTMTFGYLLALLVRVGLFVVLCGQVSKTTLRSANDVGSLCLQVAFAATLLFPSLLFPPLVRTGSPRLAYYYTRTLTPFAMRMAPCSSACLVALRALLHRGRASESQLAFIERRFKRDRFVDASQIACHGIIAELRGDRATMMDALHAVIALDHPTRFVLERRVGRYVRSFVVDLLVADAMVRDDFGLIRYLATYTRDGFARCVRLLVDRIAGAHDAPSDAALVLTFMGSRHRRLLYTLLRRALAIPRTPPARNAAPVGASEILARAMKLDAISDPRARYDDARAVAEAWDAYIDQHFTTDSDRVDAIEARLSQIVDHALPEIPFLPRPADEPFLLHEARETQLDRAFASLGDLANDFRDLARRSPADVVFLCSVVWGRTLRIWRPLRQSDHATRRAAYDHVRNTFWNAAVALLDFEQDSTVTHSVFSFLLAEAHTFGMNSDIEALTRNRELCE